MGVVGSAGKIFITRTSTNNTTLVLEVFNTPFYYFLIAKNTYKKYLTKLES